MRSTSIHSCLCAIIFSAATFSVGVAQERDPGTRLIMEQDSGKARLILEGAADEPEEPGEGVSVGVRGRYVTVPDAIFDAFLLDHTSFHSYSLGLEVGFDGPAKSRIIVGVDYTDLGMPSGNFRQDKKRPDQASFTEVDLHMIALDVTFLWKYKIIEQFGLVYGVGLGIAYTPGTITQVDVLPDCTQPSQVPDCGHWENVTKKNQDLPSEVWPLLIMQAGFFWDPVPGFRLRFEAGFRDVIFAGISGRSTF